MPCECPPLHFVSGRLAVGDPFPGLQQKIHTVNKHSSEDLNVYTVLAHFYYYAFVCINVSVLLLIAVINNL